MQNHDVIAVQQHMTVKLRYIYNSLRWARFTFNVNGTVNQIDC